ncbi:MAG: acetate--CoA ligase family protein [Candidatus Pacebacteria bacterium]|nr:acetate--CoA ligase family protein [Candidatus Paceibacterota bacterium]
MEDKKENLNRLFNPRKIVIIGASNRPGSVGNSLVKNLINNHFPGEVFFVNPKRQTIAKQAVYHQVVDLPDGIDLALIATPAATVPGIIEECIRKKIGGAAVISAGFAETGAKGKKLSSQIKKNIKRNSFRVLGPNCLGFIRPHLKINASFSGEEAQSGRVTFLSQSGALGAAVLNWAKQHQIGFANFVSLGEMLDISFGELMDYFADDPTTNSLLIYMESISKPRLFIRAAQSLSRKKPIVILKGGTSTAGARAALSHTGNLAGNELVFDTVFRRAGILRVHSLEDLFNCISALAKQNIPLNNRLAIITNAGGPGVIASDILEKNQGQLAKFEKRTTKKLKTILPSASSLKNPVDLLGDATPELYYEAARICLCDSGVDGLLVILTPQGVTDAEGAARAIAKLKDAAGKKIILAVWMGEAEGLKTLHRAQIPAYQFPGQGIRTFLYLYSYHKNLKNLNQAFSLPPTENDPRSKSAAGIIRRAFKEKRAFLSEYESKKLIRAYSFPTLDFRLAKTAFEAVKQAKKIGFPVVLKLHTTETLHKLELNGVKLNLDSPQEVRKAYDDIKKGFLKQFPDSHFAGVLIEPMLSHRYELFLGGKKDSIFGPVIVFGRGGIDIELTNDIVTELPPLNPLLAENLISKTRIACLFTGFRKQTKPDLKKLIFLLCRFSKMLIDFPQIKEVDINPLAVSGSCYQVLDAKIILDLDCPLKPTNPFGHLVIPPNQSR